MTLQAREQKAKERLQKIIERLEANANPSEVAQLLADHYLNVSRECICGLTPRPDLRDWWGKFYTKYAKLAQQFKKIEDA